MSDEKSRRGRRVVPVQVYADQLKAIRAKFFGLPNVRNDESMISITLAEDLVEQLAVYSKKNNQSREEACASLIRAGLLSADQSGAGETGEQDPDNMGGSNTDRQKEHESLTETRSASVMTAAETFRQKAELQGKIAGFIEQGNFAAAKQCERVFDAYDRHETAANEPTDEKKREALVAAIVKHGSQLMRR